MHKSFAVEDFRIFFVTISVAEFQRFIFLEPILVALGLCVLASRSESKHMCNSQRIKAGGLQEIASEDRGKKQQLKKKKTSTGHTRKKKIYF